MENFPIHISIVFFLTAILAAYIFYLAAGKSRMVLLVIGCWMLINLVISLTGFYTVTGDLPPRLALGTIVPYLLIISLFSSRSGKNFLDALDIKILTILHIVRIPVELVLFWLFINKSVPEIMTFQGRNFDILAGLSAPLIYYFGFAGGIPKKGTLIIWNCVSLLLLFNIVFYAVFSVPFPFQQFGFEQPNTAVLYFPFVWLPTIIVPLVFLSHLASLRTLMK